MGGRFAGQPLSPSDKGDAFATLHKQGWAVLGGAPRELDDGTIAEVMSCAYEPIFNGQPVGDAPLRFMGTSGSWTGAVEQVLTEALFSAGLLTCSDGSLKTVNDCYALRSLKCDDDEVVAEVVGRQPAHSDCPAPLPGEPSLAQLAATDVPLSALLAIEPGTKLWVFPSGCEAAQAAAQSPQAAAEARSCEAARLVRLNVGEVMVWRGDLVHAGAGYALTHTRVHAYVDPPPQYYRRPRGKTNLCRAAA